MAEPLEFRPARPPLRELVPLLFLALLFLVLALQKIGHSAPVSLVGLSGLALLIAGGIWLRLRYRFPGDPTLRVDGEGMSYVRGGREQALKWSEIAAIHSDFTLNPMLFVPTSGQKRIAMHHDMIAADGRSWVLLIEDYWRPPKDKGRRSQRR